MIGLPKDKRMYRGFSATAFLLAIVYTFGIDFNSNFQFVNSDVAAWLSYFKIIADNPNLVLFKDVFEINFPTSVLIYWPAFLLAENGIPYKVALYPFVFGSLFLGFLLTKKANYKLGHAYLISGSLVILMTPQTFAQREFFIMLFMMPYIFFLTQGVFGISRKIALFLAVISFMIKPFYALPILMVFLHQYYLFPENRKNLNLDLLKGLFILFSLALALIILFPGYREVIPFLFDYSSESIEKSITQYFLPIIYLYLSVFAGIYSYYKKNWVIFYILVGLFIGVIFQGKMFSYHFIPLIFVLNIFLVNLVADYKKYHVLLVFFLISYIPLNFIQAASINDFYMSKYKLEKLMTTVMEANNCIPRETAALAHLSVHSNFVLNGGMEGFSSPSSTSILSFGKGSSMLGEYNYKLIEKESSYFSCIFVTQTNAENYPELLSGKEPVSKIELDESSLKLNLFLYK